MYVLSGEIMKFTGSLEELKEKLEPMSTVCNWNESNLAQIQIRHQNKGIMNWYSSTGTINFQGDEVGRKELERLVTEYITGEVAIIENEDNISDVVATIPELENQDDSSKQQEFIESPQDSELVIGLVGAVGSRLGSVQERFEGLLTNHFNYQVETISVSKDVISKLPSTNIDKTSEYSRISSSMDAGNKLRKESGDNSFLSSCIVERISELRDGTGGEFRARTAYIVSSLKHPEEVIRLRRIYGAGFFLVSVYEDITSRTRYLTDDKNIDSSDATKLIARDSNESSDYGQHTTDAFHMADYFLHLDDSNTRLSNDTKRFLDLIFGNPYVTPTFDEYANFMAFSAALRSADLSRQVGAVVSRDETILATGANDVPKSGGGLYWPQYDEETHTVKDVDNGRDYMKGFDPNVHARHEIVEDIIERLPEEQRAEVKKAIMSSKLKDITEYGRCVHAEMEALMSCARERISTKKTTLYTTTFPCHNCAKHIIAAGVSRVVFVEPYPKSKALDFHAESVKLGFSAEENWVVFVPFVGVGPRRFFDLFSMSLGAGYSLARKNKDGTTIDWNAGTSQLRMQMLPYSYVEREKQTISIVARLKGKLETN